ncbi:MAG: 3-deoxy-7-phosphoheptulonate synthase [Planctomycetota bacterium]|jgi:3-deoxy-7-phosphoheptulonate synthase|nr:3-deoxy-7-phosphoheptulonate synthase [Planctomycetota bacterium]
MSWSRGGWRSRKSSQIPDYPNPPALREAEDRLKTYPPLVFAGEIRQLKSELARVADGGGFLLQGGDCAETFADFNTFNIRDTFRVLLQMALILTFVGEKPVVRVGRVAGQFAKPRSNPTEKTPEGEIPSYRGDMINRREPAGRTPDPERMIRAYFQSAATLNLLRAFAGGGYADIHKASKWLLDFVGKSPVREKYEALARGIDKTIGVMRAYESLEGGALPAHPQRIDFYSSHEALFLPYEEALCRNDSLTGDPVAGSAHFLWLGERTRDPEGPHTEFLRGVVNPIGIKCGPGAEPREIERLLEKLNPDNEKGRITLILRAGVGKAELAYSRLIREIVSAGREVVWCIDPMHGNPRLHSSGVKTRYFTDILYECKIFIEVCRAEKVHPGGLHLEMTGKNVSECLGGFDSVDDLSRDYETTCDPRLNASQALELAFAVAECLAADRG